jgi:hypothetical protein
MINQIKKHYNNCNNVCHEEHSTSFYINDVLRGKCITSTSIQNATCLIQKESETKIDFVAIDCCLITDNTIEKCDVVVTNKKEIWFIELKEILKEGRTRKEFNNRKKKNTEKKQLLK